jgi:quinol monooxygenase YgiN
MLIVTGTMRARPDTIEELLALCLQHVHRSRQEPGCLVHSVHRDAEDPLRVVFFEQWEDADALRTHVGVPASNSFIKEAAKLSATRGEMAIYEAKPTGI